MADWSTAAVGIAAVVVAPAATLLGVWIGKRLDRGSAQEAWLRTERRVAYAQNMANLQLVWATLVERYHEGFVNEDRTHESVEAANKATWRAQVEVEHSTATVALVGPEAVRLAAKKANDFGFDLYGWLGNADNCQKIYDQHAHRIDHAEATKAFIHAQAEFELAAIEALKT